MRNLWLFLVKYYALFLFLCLEFISLSLVFKHNNYQQASVINSANDISGSFYTSLNDITSYLALSRINDNLATENARLKNELAIKSYNNRLDTNWSTDTISVQQYHYIVAKVINNSTIHRNNYLTLNRGRIHGIRKDMGVVCSNGIVGIVKDVSEHYSTVISLLHKDIRISSQLASTKDFGSLVWEGISPRRATLIDIPNHVKVKTGDRVTTTSFSSIFPDGVPIGIVTNAEIKEGDSFYSIDVLLSTNFANLQYVYVIDNIMEREQKKLEETLKYD